MTEDVRHGHPDGVKKSKECSYLARTGRQGTIHLLGLSLPPLALIVKESSLPQSLFAQFVKNVLKANFHPFSSRHSCLEITLSVPWNVWCKVLGAGAIKLPVLLGKTTSNCESSNSVTSVSYRASKTSYFLGKCQVSNITAQIWVSSRPLYRQGLITHQAGSGRDQQVWGAISYRQHQHPNYVETWPPDNLVKFRVFRAILSNYIKSFLHVWTSQPASRLRQTLYGEVWRNSLCVCVEIPNIP